MGDKSEGNQNVRLVLALGGEEPGGDGHGDDDDQADEDAVSVEGRSREAGTIPPVIGAYVSLYPFCIFSLCSFPISCFARASHVAGPEGNAYPAAMVACMRGVRVVKSGIGMGWGYLSPRMQASGRPVGFET